jgi:hypothetical protein
VVLRLGPFKIPWPGRDPRRSDPYWDFFINTPPADVANTVIAMIREAPQGSVFPTKADIHTPQITSNHVKEMARYLGADLIGIAELTLENVRHLADGAKGNPQYPFAVVCAVRADYDPRRAPGIGGQVPVQNGLFITFVLSAWIRELGFRATVKQGCKCEALAVAAGMGRLDSSGRLVTAKFGARVHVADVILTDLPLAPDG